MEKPAQQYRSLFEERVAKFVRLGIPLEDAATIVLFAIRNGRRAAAGGLPMVDMICRASDAMATWDERHPVAS